MRNTASPAQPLAVYGSAHTSTTPWTTWSKRCEASANCWRECGLFVRYLLRPEFSPPLSGRVGDPFPSRRTHLALLRSEPLAKLGRFGSLDRGPQLRCAAAIRLLPVWLTTRLTRVPGALVAVGVVRLNPAVFPQIQPDLRHLRVNLVTLVLVPDQCSLEDGWVGAHLGQDYHREFRREPKSQISRIRLVRLGSESSSRVRFGKA